MNTYLRARNFKSRLDIIVAIFGLAFVLVLTIFGQARAGEAKLALITPNDVKAGSLLLKSNGKAANISKRRAWPRISM